MIKRVKKNKSGLVAADFFAGIGGLRLGFEKAGYHIAYANDNDPYCCKTYRANFGTIDETDIRAIDTDKLPDFDVLLAGFPCQPFSMVGKRQGFQDQRGQLFFQVIRILNAKRPRAFLLENVKHLRSYSKGKDFARILKNLEFLGYNVHWNILNSKDFGVPQHRERLFIVGFREPNIDFKFPKSNKRVNLSSILEEKVDESYYLSEKYYRGLLRHKRRHQKRGTGFGCEILDPQGISRTLLAGNMGRERNLVRDIPVPKNRWGVRKLTIRECARLQGFPDNFKVPVPRTPAYEQFGNAVTVPVVRALAIQIRKVLENA